MTARIVVDSVLCQGHGVCESEAPEVFAVPKVGVVEVLDPTPGPERAAAVAAAVKFCPTHALTLVEED